ncbi:MAG: hypothetical protein IAA97_06055 [Spirochaetes bacterium]|uniref:Uncharacterized protein n=1 Tax=Candidatus Ornithospirochaeta stercoripullorum TaxID=2840899 RepID=A0A9D9DYS8_9SPIO|nr:hypothetical protein [Candidatus Ornithospirochaeta stercoripullorum]
MKRLVLLLLLCVFGVFVYFAAFKYMVIWPLIFPLLALVAVYYVITSVVTKKMIAKARGDEDFFYQRCSMIVKDGTELQGGALAVTKNEIVFYARSSEKGGVKPIWSCFVSALEGYTMKKVDDHHPGISLSVAGEDKEVRFTSSSIQKNEKAFRAALGWPEEQN